ncbi:CR1-gamma [Human mastadenovirus D]|uniref:CR1-gamma n=3 Tax=Human mastadenovirus D TaxID=130310 RepID=B6DUB3_9ADEN|nr:CR1 gamma [Human mastadenovirus D]AZQ57183.1 E3 30.9 kDa protein [Human adenovirus 53]WKE34797.1 CR1-gamma [human adenovirus 85]BAC82700.1 E3B1-2 30.8k [Human adenovirus D8]AGT76335.1 E3 CR1-gamma [Human mastadenovirus D]
MKAFTACVLISIVTLVSADYKQVQVSRGGNITLDGPFDNTTWTRYHNDGHKNGWMKICTWTGATYKCHNNGSITIFAFNITSGVYKAEGYKKEVRTFSSRNQKHTIEDSGDYEQQKIYLYNLTIIEPPTTKAPTIVRTTTRETTHPTTTTHTTHLDTTVQNTTLLIGFLIRGNESTTDQTEATSSAFSSTANLTSLASVNETIVPMMYGQPYSGLDIQITFLVVCGIFILVVLLYFVCCKAREKSRRPIYRPVIGDPQPLQVEGGLRNLLFSFSVW